MRGRGDGSPGPGPIGGLLALPHPGAGTSSAAPHHAPGSRVDWRGNPRRQGSRRSIRPSLSFSAKRRSSAWRSVSRISASIATRRPQSSVIASQARWSPTIGSGTSILHGTPGGRSPCMRARRSPVTLFADGARSRVRLEAQVEPHDRGHYRQESNPNLRGLRQLDPTDPCPRDARCASDIGLPKSEPAASLADSPGRSRPDWSGLTSRPDRGAVLSWTRREHERGHVSLTLLRLRGGRG